MQIRGIAAVLFDMDGTLIDSEGITEVAIAELLSERGLPADEVDFGCFHGITWPQTVAVLETQFPVLCAEPVVEILPRKFQDKFVASFPPLVAGAREAVVAAAERFSTAIVTSASRMSVEYLLDRIELRGHCGTYVCADDCTRSKPDPEGYLKAAELLDVEPSRCLVFEDSVVGIRAAKAARMTAIAITCGADEAVQAAVRDLADGWVRDFEALPLDFFRTIGEPQLP